MAQNDFISEYYNPGDVGFGVSILNSSLSNPLNSSVQCRSIDPSFQTANNYANHFWLKDSQYINIPSTKSISQRIWARFTGRSSVIEGVCGVSLMAKHSPIHSRFIRNFTEGTIHPNSGYELLFGLTEGFYPDPPRGLHLRIGGYNAASTNISPIANFNVDTWVGMRMDVIPIVGNTVVNNNLETGNYGDLIEIYTASVSAPNNWQKIYSLVIGVNDSRYVPWGSYTIKSAEYANITGMFVNAYNGFGVATRQGASYGYDGTAYWDDYSVYVIDAF